MTLESAVLTKDMREVHDRSCGVEILNLDQFQNKVEDLFANGQTHPHVLAQSRRFNPGERAQRLFNGIAQADSLITIFNVDSAARAGFEHFRDHSGGCLKNVQVRYTHPDFHYPIIRSILGRNHVRMIIAGEEVLFSAFDFAESSFGRDETFYQITNPELVQAMKTVALWDYDNPLETWQVSSRGIDMIFDTGKSTGGHISRYAEGKLLKHAKPGMTFNCISSWHPDELGNTLRKISNIGVDINLIIHKPYESGFMEKPFSATKYAAERIFRGQMGDKPYLVEPPRENKNHAKFIFLHGDNEFWWMVGTSNHTRFGTAAHTTELVLAGTDEKVGRSLLAYLDTAREK